MNQRANDMGIKELAEAIKIKEKKGVEILFGMDIVTDTKIPEGTIALGEKRADGTIEIKSITQLPEEPKTDPNVFDNGGRKIVISDDGKTIDISTNYGDTIQFIESVPLLIESIKKAKELREE